MMKPLDTPLELFHPIVKKWFKKKYKEPTEIQRKAWPNIINGESLLISAPTGSGKTITAFLWAIDRLLSGKWSNGVLKVLYISPLKALNNDIQVNLKEPLLELKELFKKDNIPFDDIRTGIRSGDTPLNERQRMLRKPPEIFITTPESLNLLLTSKKAPFLFSELSLVILDEVHATVSNKRGTHLITAIERLTRYSTNFQRIGLTATVNPINKVADFIGGYIKQYKNGECIYSKRKISVIKSQENKKYSITVDYADIPKNKPRESTLWTFLIPSLKERIKNNCTTLVFANSRRETEKITRLINDGEENQLAYSHHGSLSKEIRYLVEQKLKAGELKAVIATGSLELGIDIGSVDEVIQIRAPFSVSSGVQRAGRAGHRVNETSRIRFFPLVGLDFAEAAVMSNSVFKHDIEELIIPDSPLDVLAQVIISMTVNEVWDIDKLFEHIKCSYSYHLLSKNMYNSVLKMLSGKYSDSRIRELESRIIIDKIDNTIQAKLSAKHLIYLSGGTIADRGYFDLRIKGSGEKIGELDEEFVWERTLSENFVFGTQGWKITKIDHQKVEVVPEKNQQGMIPFWKAEQFGRDYEFSKRVGEFIKYINSRLYNADAVATLKTDYFMNDSAIEALFSFFTLQKEITGSDLPHRNLIVIEHSVDPYNKADSKQIIVHTLWGGRVNLTFAMAVTQAWEDEYNYSLRSFRDDNAILFELPHDFDSQKLIKMVRPDNVESLLRKRLEKTGLFGAMFRENASRALLLPKQGFNKRMPLWFNRLRSKKLLEAVQDYIDFPIITETWKSCINQVLDVSNLKIVLSELNQGIIKINEIQTNSPSPFCSNLIWQQTDTLMYESDKPDGLKISKLSSDIFESVIFSANLRPKIPKRIIIEFEQKIQRLYPGYSPKIAAEVLNWIKERVFIEELEFKELLKRIEIDHGLKEELLLSEISSKIEWLFLNNSKRKIIIALERKSEILNALLKETEDLPRLICEWLRYYGPVSKGFILKIWGINSRLFKVVINSLQQDQTIIWDYITLNSKSAEICDLINLEHLLRVLRRNSQSNFKVLDNVYLPLFLAQFSTGLTKREDNLEFLQNSLEELFGFSCSPELWEQEIFPARIKNYQPNMLDTLLQNSELIWFGCGKNKLSFCFESERELFINSINKKSDEIRKIFCDKNGKYSFTDLLNYSELHSRDLTKLLWDNVWENNINNDSYEVVRTGIYTGFKSVELTGSKTSTNSLARVQNFNKWKKTKPFAGNWYLIKNDIDDDELLEEERRRNRVRQLLARYGILFRAILEKEIPLLSWSDLFKSLRIMELSGELISGYFFKELKGPQFVSKEAYNLLLKGLNDNEVYWTSAVDPVSLCGVDIKGLKSILPKRISSTHMVFHGKNLVLVSRKKGKLIEINVKPDNKNLPLYLNLFKEQLEKKVNPLRFVKVESINGVSCSKSCYKNVFISNGFLKDAGDLILYRKF